MHRREKISDGKTKKIKRRHHQRTFHGILKGGMRGKDEIEDSVCSVAVAVVVAAGATGGGLGVGILLDRKSVV